MYSLTHLVRQILTYFDGLNGTFLTQASLRRVTERVMDDPSKRTDPAMYVTAAIQELSTALDINIDRLRQRECTHMRKC